MAEGVARIRENPALGVRARNVRQQGIQRLPLPRVHYDLYYRVMPNGDIQVLALWHIRRGSPPF